MCNQETVESFRVDDVILSWGNKRMNKKIILIFAYRLEGVAELTRCFVSKGFTVFVENYSTNFFSALRDQRPDRVLISLSVETGLHSYLYAYVRNRYQVPVFTFHETSGNGLNDEIVGSLDSNGPIYIGSKNSEEIFMRVTSTIFPDAEVVQELPIEMYEFFENIHSKMQRPNHFFTAEKFDLYSLTITSSEGRCHLSIAISQGENSPEFRKMSFEQILFELEGSFAIKPEIEVYTTPVASNYVDRLRSKYDFPLIGKMSNVELGLFAKPLPLKDSLNFNWDEHANLFIIPMEAWMMDGELDFHIYLWMPANQHRVLYVRRGKAIETRQFARLKSHGVAELGVLPTDIKIYQQRRRALNLDSEAEFKAIAET